MKQIIVFSLLLIFYSASAQVIISEFQSSNSSTISDEWGDYDFWIELSDDDSYGICPDGNYQIFDTPTPMEANNCEITINQTIRTDDFMVYPKITGNKIFLRAATRRYYPTGS